MEHQIDTGLALRFIGSRVSQTRGTTLGVLLIIWYSILG